MRCIGGLTIRSLSHIAKLQSIADGNEVHVPTEEMVRHLLTDNEHIAKRQRVATDLADEMCDHPTSNLLQELLDETEKRIWFLYEVINDTGKST